MMHTFAAQAAQRCCAISWKIEWYGPLVSLCVKGIGLEFKPRGYDGMKAPILLALAVLSTAQAAEPTGTLTLACNGTMTDMTKTDVKPEPISMGIVFDFSARTVAGFASSLADLSPRVEIKAVDEAGVVFAGSLVKNGSWTINGTVDRVTGALEALESLANGKLVASYSLKCKPTQRMF